MLRDCAGKSGFVKGIVKLCALKLELLDTGEELRKVLDLRYA